MKNENSKVNVCWHIYNLRTSCDNSTKIYIHRIVCKRVCTLAFASNDPNEILHGQRMNRIRMKLYKDANGCPRT